MSELSHEQLYTSELEKEISHRTLAKTEPNDPGSIVQLAYRTLCLKVCSFYYMLDAQVKMPHPVTR